MAAIFVVAAVLWVLPPPVEATPLPTGQLAVTGVVTSGGKAAAGVECSCTYGRRRPCDGRRQRQGTHTARNASVGERRAARIDGYRPATAPTTKAAPTPL
jgi:hypothetical protein